MSAVKDGGAAFPSRKIVGGDNYNPTKEFHLPGMSLRDYFAAKAMLGEITHQGLEGREIDHIAGMAYEMANAMLRAREVQP